MQKINIAAQYEHPSQAIHMPRNKAVDIVRGFAIALMVIANMSPLYENQFPFWLRCVFSIYAPILVSMSGFMAAYLVRRYDMAYFFKRGAFLVAIGVLMDVCISRIIPFQGFDVLYLIGFSFPLVGFLVRCSKWVIYSVIIAILIIAELLRAKFGYDLVPVISPLIDEVAPSSAFTYSNWFIDGWFPLFPWVAVMLAGALVGKLYLENASMRFFESKQFLYKVIITFITGIGALFCFGFSPLDNREGYAEIFYPPSSGVMLLLFTIVMLLLALAEYMQRYNTINKLLGSLGRCTLAIYIFHVIFIELVVSQAVFLMPSVIEYFSVTICHEILVYGFAVLLNMLKARYKEVPTLVSWVIGK